MPEENYKPMGICDDFLERGYHCKVCHLELTPIELELFNSLCVFHAGSKRKRYSSIKMFYKAILDLKIYSLMWRYKEKYGEGAQTVFVATLGVVGVYHPGALITIEQKRKFIKELKECLKTKKNIKNP